MQATNVGEEYQGLVLDLWLGWLVLLAPPALVGGKASHSSEPQTKDFNPSFIIFGLFAHPNNPSTTVSVPSSLLW